MSLLVNSVSECHDTLCSFSLRHILMHLSVAAVDKDEVPRLLTSKLMVVSKPDIIGLTGDPVTKCVSRLGAKQPLQQWSCSLCVAGKGIATFHSEDSFRYCRIVCVCRFCVSTTKLVHVGLADRHFLAVLPSCRTCCRQCSCMHNVQTASDS